MYRLTALEVALMIYHLIRFIFTKKTGFSYFAKLVSCLISATISFQLNWRKDVLLYQIFCLRNINLFLHGKNVFQNHFVVCGLVCDDKPIFKRSYAWVDPIGCFLGHSWIWTRLLTSAQKLFVSKTLRQLSTIKWVAYLNTRGIRELRIRGIRRRWIQTIGKELWYGKY